MTEIERRVAIAQATLDHWRDRPFRLGHNDCARLAASHLRRMGHQVRLPPTGSYRTELGAAKALRRLGWATLAEAMDGMGFVRIAPAAALPGDILSLPGEGVIGTLMVHLSNGRSVGFHQDRMGVSVLQPLTVDAMWRIKTHAEEPA